MYNETTDIHDYMGEDVDLSFSHAVREGSHDAMSGIVRYSIIGAVALVGAAIFLDEKVIRKIKNRFIGG